MTRFRDIVEAAFPGINKGAQEDEWQVLCDLVDNTPHSKTPRGMPELLDFVAQVWNGGLHQYIDNGYAKDDWRKVESVLHTLGPAGKSVLDALDEFPEQLSSYDEVDVDDEEMMEALDEFDTWFYAGPDKQLVKEMLEKMRSL